MERSEPIHVVGFRRTSTPAGLHDCGQILEGRVAKEGGEPGAEQPVTHPCVPVAVRTERGLRVVDVEAAEPVEADPGVELCQRIAESRRVGDVDAGGVPVAGVDAETKRGVAVERVEERLAAPRPSVPSCRRRRPCSRAGATSCRRRARAVRGAPASPARRPRRIPRRGASRRGRPRPPRRARTPSPPWPASPRATSRTSPRRGWPG